MSSVDNRIVNMEFNNKQFTQGVNQTERDLTGLEKSLASAGKSKGLTSLGSAAQQVSVKFSAMQVAGAAAIATIVSKATSAGINLVKSFTLAPLMQGFEEYNTNLKSIQTVMANTGAGINEVNGYMDKLNQYSDKTIYNFSEMARNIGTFTAAGVGLKEATSSIQGISNMAALSGSSSQQASSAMYQLSQAIAAGRVNLQDWNSVVNAGMGGKNLQKALITTGQAMGTVTGQVDLAGKTIKIAGKSFRESISAVGNDSPWLTSDVLVKTFALMDGRLSKASIQADHLGWSTKRVNKELDEQQKLLKKQGYTDQQIDEITDMANRAYESATVVKTLPQLMGVVKESLGSVWAQAFEGIIGNFNQSKKLWTSASNSIGEQVRGFGMSLNRLIAGWSRNGGRIAVIEGLKSGFKTLGIVLGTLKRSFQTIFPPKTGKDLADLSKGFADFMDRLTPSIGTMMKLSYIFQGFFAIISIGWQIVKGFVGVIVDLFGEMSGSAGGLLDFGASIGKMLVAFDEALKSGEGLTSFFDGLRTVLAVPVKLINAIAEAFFSLFGGFDEGAAQAVEGSFKRVGDRVAPLASFSERAAGALRNIFSGLGNLMEPVIEAFSNLGTAIGESLGEGSFSAVFDAINTGLLGGITYLLYSFFKDGLNLNLGVGGSGGFFSSITSSFEALTGTLEGMQTKLKADALLRIAAAIAIIAGSIVILSLIDSKKLTSALVGLGVGFGMLLGAMTVLEHVSTATGFIKMPFIAASLILLSTAILILTAAVALMSLLSWEDMAKGLLGIAGALTGVAIAMQLMPKGMLLQAAALMALGLALNELAVAMTIMAQLSWEELGRGLAGVAGSLVVIAGAMRLMPKGMVLQAAALVILAGALNAMAGAVAKMGAISWETMGRGIAGIAGAIAAIGIAMRLMPKGMLLQAAALFILAEALQTIGGVIAQLGQLSWEEIGKGVAGIAGSLVLIAIAMQLMPVTLPLTAAGLVLVAFALQGIAAVLQSLSGMSWDEMAHGLVALGGALAVIALGVTLMSGALTGAAALLIVSAALAILVPILITLGGLSFETIATGLGTLAAAFLILGAAGYILGPSILLLGAGMLLLGAGLALAGAGMLAFSTGFAILTATGVAGVAVLMAAFDQLMDMIPELAANIAKGMIAFLEVLGKNAPKIRKAMSSIIINMLGVVEDAAPAIGRLISVLIDTGLGVIERGIPRYARAGLRIILGFLDAMDDEIPKIADKAGDLIVTFIDSVGDQAVKLANAGADMIVDVLNGLADAVETKGAEIRAAARNLAGAFAEQLRLALADMIPNLPIPDLPSPGGLLGKALGAVTGRGRVAVGGKAGMLGAGGGRGGVPATVENYTKGLVDFARVFTKESANVAKVLLEASKLLVGKASGTPFGFAQQSTAAQRRATVASTRAEIQDTTATRATEVADARREKAENMTVKKGNEKQKKARQAAIKKAKAEQAKAAGQRQLAARTAAAAEREQARADEFAQKARDEVEFEAADAQGRGDIRSRQGQDLAARAQAKFDSARAKDMEAARLEALAKKQPKGKAGKDEAKRLLAQSKALRQQAAREAAAAQNLAIEANTAQADAINQYKEARRIAAQSVTDRMTAIREQIAAEKKEREWQKKYDEAEEKGDKATMISMLETRAKEADKLAEDARIAMEAAFAEANAKKETDAVAAQAALDEAERQADLAQQYADEAAADRETVEQINKENESKPPESGGNTLTPSRIALEDAALAVDRYTTSVMQAEEAALASAGAPQFIQNNYSPEALSTSTIYRQSKNLVSAAEVKMGVGTE